MGNEGGLQNGWILIFQWTALLIDLKVLWSLWNHSECVYEHVPGKGNVEVTKPQELRSMAKHGILKTKGGLFKMLYNITNCKITPRRWCIQIYIDQTTALKPVTTEVNDSATFCWEILVFIWTPHTALFTNFASTLASSTHIRSLPSVTVCSEHMPSNRPWHVFGKAYFGSPVAL